MALRDYFSPDRPYFPWLVLLNVITTTFMAAMSSVATLIGGDAIQGELALSDTLSIWLTTLYLLALNITVPTANWFADHYGNIRIYTLSVLIFSFGAGLAAFSYNFAIIAFARVLEGIGAGMIFPIGLALIARSFPPERLPLALNLYIGCGFGGGFGLGTFVSGLLTQFYTWRYIFFLFIPFGIAAAASCWLSRRKIPEREKIPFDLWGFCSLACFIASLLVALTLAPLPSTDAGWRSPLIMGSLAVAALSFFLTLWIESRHPHPIIHLSLFKDLVFGVSAVTMFLIGMSLFGSLGTTVDYMLHGLFYEKYSSGKLAMTFGLMLGIFSMIASLLVKFLPTLLLTFSGLFLLILSFFLNNELSWLTGPEQITLILLLRGIGIGLSLGPVTTQALHDIPKELASRAATLLTFTRQVGGTYGGAVLAYFTIKQKIFHTARFGEQAAIQTTGYQETLRRIAGKFTTDVSDNGFELSAAKAAIVQNIKTQAFIQAQNDALLLFGYIGIAVFLLLLILNIRRYWMRRNELVKK